MKVNALTDIEDIVWRTYIMAADDFGIMRFVALSVQEAYDRLATRPARVIQRALDRLASVGLVQLFAHQGQQYCFQRSWQRFQKVEYPRTTIHPKPPDHEIAACDPLTQYLFSFHPGGVRVPSHKSKPHSGNDSGNLPGTFPESSGNFPGKLPEHSGTSHARSRVPARTLTANANGQRQMATGGAVGIAVADQATDTELAERAGRFIERYRELYPRFRNGAQYVGRPALDYQEALLLVGTWDSERLDVLVEAFLTTDNEFCRNGSGTLAQFRSRASWCDALLRGKGL